MSWTLAVHLAGQAGHRVEVVHVDAPGLGVVQLVANVEVDDLAEDELVGAAAHADDLAEAAPQAERSKVDDACPACSAAARPLSANGVHDEPGSRNEPDRIDPSGRPFVAYGACGRHLDAGRRGDLNAIVVRECCWSSDAEAHAYSLNKAMKMYGRVRTLDQALAMLGATA